MPTTKEENMMLLEPEEMLMLVVQPQWKLSPMVPAACLQDLKLHDLDQLHQSQTEHQCDQVPIKTPNYLSLSFGYNFITLILP